MAIQQLVIPYPDFKLQEIIDPEQFDLNNSTTVNKLNALLTVINQLTDGIASGASGADQISLTAVAPFTSVKLQAFLQELVNRLKSTTDSVSGADLVGSTAITGVTGVTVQAQLEGLKAIFDSLLASLVASQTQITTNISDIAALVTRSANVEGRATALEGRATTNEAGIVTNATNLTTHKSSVDHDGRYYIKSEVDAKTFNTINFNDRSITGLKIGLGEVKTENLANQAVTADKISPLLLDNVIISTHRNTSVLDHPALSVTTEKLNVESVTFDKLSPTVITYIDNAGTKVATGISVTDAGNYYAGVNVETAMQEVGATLVAARGAIITAMTTAFGS